MSNQKTSAYFSTSNEYIKYCITAYELEVDTENNRSKVRILVEAWRTNTGYVTNRSGACWVRETNTGYWSSTTWEYPDKPISYNSDTDLFDKTEWFDHDADGTKRLYIESEIAIYRVGSGDVTSSYNGFYFDLTPIDTGVGELVARSMDIEERMATFSLTCTEACYRYIWSYDTEGRWYVIYSEPSAPVKSVTVTIQDLQPSTEYTIYFRCLDQPNWVDVYNTSITFTTEAEPYELTDGPGRITLFESNTTNFSTNGLGSLTDAISCTVTEERNGQFELEMVYPINGTKYDLLAFRRIILSKPNKYKRPQPFRIYSISKPINGKVTVHAAHISYDLSGITVGQFNGDTPSNTFANMKAACDVTCPFTFMSDITTSVPINVAAPASIRSLLGGSDGTFLSVYGGEYEFDVYKVRLWEHRGEDRGVTIRYGKNLTDLKQEENCSNVYTAVRPYWLKQSDSDGEAVLVDLPEKLVNILVGADYNKILPLDLTSVFEEAPSAEELRSAAEEYISANNLSQPIVSLDVSFVQLAETEEYKNYALLEQVQLCDVVTVEFPKLGVSSKAKCIKTVYDAIAHRYKSISLSTTGEEKSTLTSTVSNQGQAIKNTASKTELERSINNTVNTISSTYGAVTYGYNTDAGSGESGYLRIARISVVKAYSDAPIKMEVFRRTDDRSVCLYLKFDSVSSINTDVDSFCYDGAAGVTNPDAFVVKVETGVFDIYICKATTDDIISALFTVPISMKINTVFEFVENHVSSKPSGAITATAFT